MFSDPIITLLGDDSTEEAVTKAKTKAYALGWEYTTISDLIHSPSLQ